MSAQDEELRGVAFQNDRQREGKKDADYTGNATIGGIQYYVDIWINTPKAGGKDFLGIRFKPKHSRANDRGAQNLRNRHGGDGWGSNRPGQPDPRSQAARREAEKPKQEDFNDDIPF